MRPPQLTATLLLAILAGLVASASPASAARIVTTDGVSLTRFDSAALAATTTVPVSGLQAAETLTSIDFRPSDGRLYGVGSTNRLYVMDPVSGAATAIGLVPFTPALSGTAFGGDFNPTVDRYRSVSNTGQNLRINPFTGAIAASDPALNPPISIHGAAYTNNIAGAASTALYDISATNGLLYLQSPPNNGTLVAVGPLGPVGMSQNLGFDIAPDGVAYASMTIAGQTRLYTVNLASGSAAPVSGNAGLIGTGTTIFVGLTVAPPSALRIRAATPEVGEGGPAAFTVTRDGLGIGAVSVSYSTAAGSAAAGADFTAAEGTLSWADGEVGSRSVAVATIDDAAAEGAETFSLNLAAPSADAVVVGAPSAVATIVASDPASATPPPPPDTRAPRLVLGGANTQKLSTARARGVSLSVRSDEACLLEVQALLSKTDAKRLKIPARVGSTFTIARVGTRSLRLVLSERASRRLRGRRRVSLTLSATCRDVPGNRSATAKRKLSLRR